MSKPLSFFGQINFTELKEAMKSGHVKMQKIQTKKGEQIFVDVNVWVHEEADQFNNNASIQLQLRKEAFEGGMKNTFYIGNLRYQQPKSTDVSQEEVNELLNDDDDLPF